MVTITAPHAADWALAHGRSALTTAELAEALAVPEPQVRQRLQAPRRRGEWVSPAHGLWLPVPPEYRTWGAPQGIEVIDLLAHHLGVDYYVGWLAAAALHGAAHMAPQVMDVAVSRQVRGRDVGRTRFQFHRRSGLGALPVVSHPTRSGTARVSSLSLTALDLAADPDTGGGLDNTATVLLDLAEQPTFDPVDLAGVAAHFPTAAARRLGWILDRHAAEVDLEPLLRQAIAGTGHPSRLDPSRNLSGPLDERWNVRVNHEPEPDL